MDAGDAPGPEDVRDDRDLYALFAREPAHFPEQPFVDDLAQLVAHERRRRAIIGRFVGASLIGVAIAALIAAAPWLISGSELLSAELGVVFAAAADALASPFGYGAGLTVVAAALVFRRRLFG
jgi:hypothetical protein